MHEKNSSHTPPRATRRTFLQGLGTAAVASQFASPFVHASDKAGSRSPVLGEGGHRYEATHGWGELPDHIQWGDTHGVCVDREGLIYIKHQSAAPEPMDAIAVFDAEGSFVRSFGQEYHGGGHGIDLRLEGNEEFLYLCDIKNRIVDKTTLTGERVWRLEYPREPDVYASVDQYRPTNVAFAPDGGFYIGDGYGSHYIHQYDAHANWIRTWGGAGAEPGKMKTPHGLWWDDRPGREPSLVVADRANARLQYFSPEGQHLGFFEEVSFPAHFDIRGSDLLVPDLHARVTILDGRNQVITHLGYDAEWTQQVLQDNLRNKPEKWQAGRFIHPHDACYDHEGNIFVVEWVPIGRVTKLRHVS